MTAKKRTTTTTTTTALTLSRCSGGHLSGFDVCVGVSDDGQKDVQEDEEHDEDVEEEVDGTKNAMSGFYLRVREVA